MVPVPQVIVLAKLHVGQVTSQVWQTEVWHLDKAEESCVSNARLGEYT